MKKLLPPSLRLFIRVAQRNVKDIATGIHTQLVSHSDKRIQKGIALSPQISLSQPIYLTDLSKNKIHNLQLAIRRIENIILEPGEIFSFWHLVGKPDKSKGYLIGRSLIQNELKANYGGGLCQLSGLLYYLALQAGLSIVERSAHSLDIYTEKTRFTPLGSDATVVYGYKDLRLQNNLNFPICFRFQLESDLITGFLCATNPVVEYKIGFIHEKTEDGVRVATVRYTKEQAGCSIVDTSVYKKITVAQECELIPKDR